MRVTHKIHCAKKVCVPTSKATLLSTSTLLMHVIILKYMYKFSGFVRFMEKLTTKREKILLAIIFTKKEFSMMLKIKFMRNKANPIAQHTAVVSMCLES